MTRWLLFSLRIVLERNVSNQGVLSVSVLRNIDGKRSTDKSFV